MRCLRTRGLVRWDGRRAQGGGSDWYTHHGVRWGSSLTPNGSGMRIGAATCPTVCAQVEGNRSIFVRSISGRVEFPRVSISRTLGIIRTVKSEGRLVGFCDKFTRRMATFVYCPTTRIQSLGGRLPIADRVSRGRGQSRGVKRIPGRSIRRYDSELPVGQDAPPASRGVKRQYEPSQEPYGPSRVGEYADDVDDVRPNVAFEPIAGPP